MARRSRWAPLAVPVGIGLVAVGALAGAAVWGGERFQAWFERQLGGESPALTPAEYEGPRLGPVAAGTTPQPLRVVVLDTRPHDPAAFTQGLVWHDGVFLEST